MARKQNKNVKTDLKKIAQEFRSRTFFSETEASDFSDYARKEGLSDVQMWKIPDAPVKWKVAWMEK